MKEIFLVFHLPPFIIDFPAFFFAFFHFICAFFSTTTTAVGIDIACYAEHIKSVQVYFCSRSTLITSSFDSFQHQLLLLLRNFSSIFTRRKSECSRRENTSELKQKEGEQTHAVKENKKKWKKRETKLFHGKLCRKVDDDSGVFVCERVCSFEMTFL